MRQGIRNLQRIADTGCLDDEAAAWLTAALIGWSRHGGNGDDLLRRLHVPTTAAARRRATRDYWLAAAADQLDQNPARLADAADRFERRLWPLWGDLSAPPSHASAIDGCLFLARRAGPLPTSKKQYQRIIADTFSPESVQADRP